MIFFALKESEPAENVAGTSAGCHLFVWDFKLGFFLYLFRQGSCKDAIDKLMKNNC